MKKYLLSLLASSCLVLSVSAQTAVKTDRNKVIDRKVERTDATPKEWTGLKPDGVRADISLTDISSSINIFSVLVAQQHCLIYNPELDALMFTNRGNTGVIATGNELVSSVSTDDGVSFTSEISLPDASILRRYPSGIIYNPSGNTDLANAFRLMVGPRTESNNWSKTYLGSNTFGNLYADEKMVNNTTGHDLIVRHGLSVDADGIAHICGMAYSTNSQSYVTFGQGIVMRGVFNATTNQFEWSEQTLAPEVNHASDQTWDLAASDINVAFSPDGQIGYVTFVGADARSGDDLCAYQPIVYKSTDRGLTWEIMDYLNLKNHPALVEYLPGLKRDFSIVKPSVSETDLVVDADGNAHIFMLCKGASSDHPDSLGYVYTADMGTVFELFNAGQGNDWLIQYIDTLQTDYVKAEESGYGVGDDAVGWDHRLQAGLSEDGKVVFATWTDSDKEFFGVETNLYPDLFGWARDTEHNRYTEVVDFTGGSEVWGDNFFHFMSPVVKKTDDGFMIPITTTDIHTNNDPDLPVFHRFVQGISFADADFIIDGASEYTPVSFNINVFPNPANDELNVTLSGLGQQDVVAHLYDLTGARVATMEKGNAGSSTTHFSFNVSSLHQGIYFLRIDVEGQSVVRKVVVD
ncbi:MAG: T9SS type A sorting domain-containing protein [Bacteroidales bacterium]|nr:T9SS type A sorting domain-containing protein [Bacteroidales bacterium]MDD3666509.1 T9SS type A sorting domain-containing protein [Bacteroidales bacterium]